MSQMTCVNCGQTISSAAVQCPFCWHNPFYSVLGDTGTPEDRAAFQTDTPANALVFTGAGLGVALAFPVCGLAMAGLGIYTLVKTLRRK